MERVIFHDHARTPDRAAVGGKAWNLYRLQRGGFRVPEWAVVTTRVLEEMLAPHREQLEQILEQADPASRRSMNEAAARAAKVLGTMTWPPGLADTVRAAAGRVADADGCVSVRSSVVGEDSSRHSFAGMMESFLNVPVAGVPQAVVQVWISAFSARALLYRLRRGLPLTGIAAAVILQRMVRPRASGVLFTRDPEDGSARCVISAAYGLGEGVVADRVETDTYKVAHDSTRIVREVERKDARIVSAPGGTVRVESLPEVLRSRAVLQDPDVLEVCRLGLDAERWFGGPQDLEWVQEEDGSVLLLQARPIVGIGTIRRPETIRVWDSSNIVESYPGLTLPLTFSFVKSAYEHTIRNAMRHLLPAARHLEPLRDVCPNMIGLIQGRVYYNLLNWYAVLTYFPGFHRNRSVWDRMIGISEASELPERPVRGWVRAWTGTVLGWRILTNRLTARSFSRRFRRVQAEYGDRDLDRVNETSLIRMYRSLAVETRKFWYVTLYNDLAAMIFYELLRRLCRRWGPRREANLHDQLLCGERGVESVAPLRSAVRLAERIAAAPRARRILEERDDRRAWDALCRDSELTDLRRRIKEHLERFGDRRLEELKLESPSLRERPDLLLRLLRGYVSRGLTVEELENREQRVRHEAARAMREAVRNPFRRLVFAIVLAGARQAVAARENMRLARTRIYGVARRLFRRMAELFVENGRLDGTDDLHYLTVEEVFDAVEGTATTRDLRRLVALRRAEYEGFALQRPPDRFVTRDGEIEPAVEEAETGFDGSVLRGTGCSAGRTEGRAWVVTDPAEADGDGDRILVAHSTDPGWVFLMVNSRGLVVEKGSVLSHTAIIGRELGIPTVVGVKDATRRIQDGDRIRIDGTTGVIQWV